MESRLKHRIFVFSLLAWTVICPSGTQQTHSLREQLKEVGVLVPVIPSKEDDLFLLLIKGLIQSFTVAYFLAL